MGRHRLPSRTLPFLPASGRGLRTLPPSAVPADLSLNSWSHVITLSALWSLALALAAQLLGPERFNAIRLATVFGVTTLAQFVFTGHLASNRTMENRR
jgi:hypothetical protein